MRWKIGNFEFDALAGHLRRTEVVRLGGNELRILKFLVKRFGEDYENEEIVAEVWKKREGVTQDPLYKAIQNLRRVFGGERESYIISRPYRLVFRPERIIDDEIASAQLEKLKVQATEDHRPVTDQRESLEARVHAPREPGTQSAAGTDSASIFDQKDLILSLDGIILNSVGELLFDRVEAEVIRECHYSYERSLEDFAFAVVYGSQLCAKWHPGSSPSQSNSKTNKEPGALVVSLLPNGLYVFEPLDEDLKNGALLRDDGDRRQVCEYIGYMSQCLQEPFFVGLCRDLLVREAEKFLGVDASLFQKVRHYSERRFGKDYYRHDLVEEIPALLGKPALATLVGFLPKSPQKDSGGKSKDNYERSALIQFVSEVVLTHITTMYEFEKGSQRQQTWRMPYALRAEITRQLSRTQQQRMLRRTVVRHVLRYALGEASGYDRKADIISTLVALRGIEPFMEIRQMLGELVVLEADEGKEGRAMKLNRDIRNASYRGGLGQNDSFSKAHNSILRELARESQIDDEYRLLQWRLFPVLEPRPLAPKPAK